FFAQLAPPQKHKRPALSKRGVMFNFADCQTGIPNKNRGIIMIAETEAKDKPEAFSQLAAFPHFVCWEPIERKNPDPAQLWKKDKIPVNARTGMNASVSDPSTWAQCEVALAALRAGQVEGRAVHGIGYVFWKAHKDDSLQLPADPFVGIDL